AGSAPHDCISSEHFGSWLGVGLIWFEGSGCDCLLMQAASLLDGFSFDLFPPFVGSATCRRKAMTPYALHRRTMAIPILLGMVGAGSSYGRWPLFQTVSAVRPREATARTFIGLVVRMGVSVRLAEANTTFLRVIE